MNSKSKKVRSICATAIMAAIIFVFTYTFKITFPSGYTHLGDCMIFLGLAILGRNRGCLAAGVGAALADLIGGYPQWILPTFFIKLIMVLICSLFFEKILKNKKLLGLALGGVAGGAFQVAAYTLVKIPLIDLAYALSSLPRIIFQTVFGLFVSIILVFILEKTKTIDKIKKIIG